MTKAASDENDASPEYDDDERPRKKSAFESDDSEAESDEGRKSKSRRRKRSKKRRKSSDEKESPKERPVSPRRQVYEAKFDKYRVNKQIKDNQEKRAKQLEPPTFDITTKNPSLPSKYAKKFKSNQVV